MNCTFYRPSTVNVREFENIVGKLTHDLHMLENQKQDEWSVSLSVRKHRSVL